MTGYELTFWILLLTVAIVVLIRRSLTESARRELLRNLDAQMDRERRTLEEIRARRKRDGARER